MIIHKSITESVTNKSENKSAHFFNLKVKEPITNNQYYILLKLRSLEDTEEASSFYNKIEIEDRTLLMKMLRQRVLLNSRS